MIFQMYVPTRILFGENQLENLHTQQLPGKKALIVISNGKSTKENGSLAKTEEQLKQAGVPPKFTAYQGFDALFHSVECYISAVANLMSDMYALTAMENIGAYLPRAVKNGSDLEARERVAFANTLSGVVMTVSACTSEHSMEHAMSAYHHQLPHGAGLIMISLEYYKHFIDKHCCDERFVRWTSSLHWQNCRKNAVWPI